MVADSCENNQCNLTIILYNINLHTFSILAARNGTVNYGDAMKENVAKPVVPLQSMTLPVCDVMAQKSNILQAIYQSK